MAIKDASSGGLVCCLGLLPIFDNTTIAQSYSAQYFELSGLESYSLLVLEVGRFCLDPAAYDGDILHFAWAALSLQADHYKIQLLFGCASFSGLEPAPYCAVEGALLGAAAVAGSGQSPACVSI